MVNQTPKQNQPIARASQATIQQLFKIAVEKQASDLHIVVGKPPIVRIDGQLEEIEGQPPLSQQQAQSLLYDIITEAQKEK